MTWHSSTMRAWTGCIIGALSFGASASTADLQPDASVPSASANARAERAPEPELAAASGADALPLRFDLVCKESWRTVHDPPDGHARPATTPPDGWDFGDRTRYLIDLGAGRYCATRNCAQYGRHEIASWNADRIVLDDQTSGDTWHFFVVNRREATLEMRITSDDGFKRRLTGICRYEPFSGFPTSRDGERRGRSLARDRGN